MSALVVLDPEVAPVVGRAAGHRVHHASTSWPQQPEVVDEINAGRGRGHGATFNNAERVKKVHDPGEEWLPDSDLLTPTSKLKRRGINARFAKEIEALYGG